jgi:hypothetical protein
MIGPKLQKNIRNSTSLIYIYLKCNKK